MIIRPAERRDLPALTLIYNHYIETTAFTFDIDPYTVETRTPWFLAFDGKRRQCLVAETDRRVIGYGCSGEFKPKAAYSTSVEVSIYVAPEEHRLGVGSTLYERLFAAITPNGVHRAYAGITLPNDPSIGLHRSFGFEQVARFDEVGFKFNRYWDVIWMERRF
jgi:phosphinothricin acetyltransferase